MNSGMLWFDNDPKTDLTFKINKAAEYYRQKYGNTPNLCLRNSFTLDEKIFREGRITVRTYRACSACCFLDRSCRQELIIAPITYLYSRHPSVPCGMPVISPWQPPWLLHDFCCDFETQPRVCKPLFCCQLYCGTMQNELRRASVRS